jgi:hypothetical protein
VFMSILQKKWANKINKKAVVSAPQPEKSDNKDLTTVYRRTTTRQNAGGFSVENNDPAVEHVARSFL